MRLAGMREGDLKPLKLVPPAGNSHDLDSPLQQLQSSCPSNPRRCPSYHRNLQNKTIELVRSIINASEGSPPIRVPKTYRTQSPWHRGSTIFAVSPYPCKHIYDIDLTQNCAPHPMHQSVAPTTQSCNSSLPLARPAEQISNKTPIFLDAAGQSKPCIPKPTLHTTKRL